MSSDSRRIGIYRGTFDPIHHAHLILAREAGGELGLEKVILISAAVLAFKGATAARFFCSGSRVGCIHITPSQPAGLPLQAE